MSVHVSICVCICVCVCKYVSVCGGVRVCMCLCRCVSMIVSAMAAPCVPGAAPQIQEGHVRGGPHSFIVLTVPDSRAHRIPAGGHELVIICPKHHS